MSDQDILAILKSDRAKAVYIELMDLAQRQVTGLIDTAPRMSMIDEMAMKLQREIFYAEQIRQAISAAMTIDLAHQQLLFTAGAITKAALQDK